MKARSKVDGIADRVVLGVGIQNAADSIYTTLAKSLLRPG